MKQSTGRSIFVAVVQTGSLHTGIVASCGVECSMKFYYIIISELSVAVVFVVAADAVVVVIAAGGWQSLTECLRVLLFGCRIFM